MAEKKGRKSGEKWHHHSKSQPDAANRYGRRVKSVADKILRGVAPFIIPVPLLPRRKPKPKPKPKGWPTPTTKV
tara:strand:- start:1573 stop:1794 length:222 start_codon:yes stop_codon:yes gene_type:complete